MSLDHATTRFALSGTLITLFALADWIAHRSGGRTPRHAMPRAAKVVIFLSIGAFYALIGPAGGPIAGGLGNLAGAGLALIVLIARVAIPGARAALLARAGFYVALPIAVGVPWGLAALSLPALALTAWTLRQPEVPTPPLPPRPS